MSDISKPQYLTQDDKGWKLCRPIPKELRELAVAEEMLVVMISVKTALYPAQ